MSISLGIKQILPQNKGRGAYQNLWISELKNCLNDMQVQSNFLLFYNKTI